MNKEEYNRDYLWTLKEGYPPLDKGKARCLVALQVVEGPQWVTKEQGLKWWVV